MTMVPVGNKPGELTAQVKADIARWGKVIRKAASRCASGCRLHQIGVGLYVKHKPRETS